MINPLFYNPGRATKTPLQTRFLVSLSLLLYAMLLGCVRTATLGAVVANKPSYLGALPFDSRAAVTISIRTHNVVRFACFAALAVMG